MLYFVFFFFFNSLICQKSVVSVKLQNCHADYSMSPQLPSTEGGGGEQSVGDVPILGGPSL